MTDANAQHQLLATLRRHIGRGNGVTARALVAQVNFVARCDLINERDLRHLVVELRLQGHHVCAHPAHGYYIAANDEELTESLKYLTDRAMSSLRQVAAMKRVSMPDLFGQLHLPTT